MPTKFQADWQAVKAGFFKDTKSADVPPELVMLMNQGRDFGPALKAFDAAANFEKRQKAIPAVLRAKTDYLKEFRAALKDTPSRPGQAVIRGLISDVEDIWDKVEKAAQPPRPTAQMVEASTIRNYDLARGIKTECLKVDPVVVTIKVEVDKAFKALMIAEKEGAKLAELGDVAQNEIEKLRGAFHKTIQNVDAAIKKDPSKTAEKTKEANEVLQYYGRLVEDQINTKVQAHWKGVVARRADLKDFQVKTATKIVLGTIGVGVAIVSVALSFGTAWMTIIAACRGIMTVAKEIKTAGEGIDTVYAALIDDMQKVTSLNSQRERAREAGEGQKASKAAEFGKELVAAALPFTRNMVKSVSSIDARIKQFNGLISKMETQIDDLSGRIEKITAGLSGIANDRLLSTEQINLNRRMDKTIKKMFQEVAAMIASIRACVRFSDASAKAVKALKSTDTWLGPTESAGNITSRSVAIYSLINFAFACAEAGKQLTALLPV